MGRGVRIPRWTAPKLIDLSSKIVRQESGSEPVTWTVQQSRLVCTNCGSIFDADVNAKEHPSARHQPNRRTSGNGLRIEPDYQGLKLGPSGPRVVTTSHLLR